MLLSSFLAWFDYKGPRDFLVQWSEFCASPAGAGVDWIPGLGAKILLAVQSSSKKKKKAGGGKGWGLIPLLDE